MKTEQLDEGSSVFLQAFEYAQGARVFSVSAKPLLRSLDLRGCAQDHELLFQQSMKRKAGAIMTVSFPWDQALAARVG